MVETRTLNGINRPAVDWIGRVFLQPLTRVRIEEGSACFETCKLPTSSSTEQELDLRIGVLELLQAGSKRNENTGLSHLVRA